MFHFFHITLFSCRFFLHCFLFMLHFLCVIHVIIFCISFFVLVFMLHLFLYRTLFLFQVFYVAYFNTALLSSCTICKLHFVHIAQFLSCMFFMLHFFSFAFFSCYTLYMHSCTLYHSAIFSCSIFFFFFNFELSLLIIFIKVSSESCWYFSGINFLTVYFSGDVSNQSFFSFNSIVSAYPNRDKHRKKH